MLHYTGVSCVGALERAIVAASAYCIGNEPRTCLLCLCSRLAESLTMPLLCWLERPLQDRTCQMGSVCYIDTVWLHPSLTRGLP